MKEAFTTSANSAKTRAKAPRALIVVDVQNDFLPGGALAVPHSDEIIAPLRELMESDAFDLIVATQDWHPRGHISFASSHPGAHPMDAIKLYGHEQTLWPDHCVQGTPGAALRVDLPWHKVAAIIRKALDPAVDSYSAFRNNWNARRERPPTGLTGYLKNHGVREVFICGLARDFCVKWSAEDAVAEGFRTFVIWDLCRSIDPSRDAHLRRSLSSRGVKIYDRADV
jgi:nicotinamidase/pyrazinamidase